MTTGAFLTTCEEWHGGYHIYARAWRQLMRSPPNPCTAWTQVTWSSSAAYTEAKTGETVVTISVHRRDGRWHDGCHIRTLTWRRWYGGHHVRAWFILWQHCRGIQGYKYYVFGHYPLSCLYLKIPSSLFIFLDKDRTVDNVQKHYICTNVPPSHTFRSWVQGSLH
jgi:hypothetical protein